MLKSNLKIAFRNLWRNKGFSAINILGLATGLTACLLILFFVIDELSYDRYNKNADRIYRIDTKIKFGDNLLDIAEAPAILGPVFAKDFPQIESYVRIRNSGSIHVKKGNEKVKEDKVWYADSTLFSVFSFPLIEGDPRTALKDPHSLVLTENMAKKYFNRTSVVGQSLVLFDTVPYRITAVIRNLPRQTHFEADFFLPLIEYPDSRNTSWFSENYNTYFVLRPGVNLTQLTAQLNKSMSNYAAPELKGILNMSMDDWKKGGGYFVCSLMPLTDIHLHSNKLGEMANNHSAEYVYIFSATALFILLIGCINFMNLSTARSSNRAKEVGIRKVLGSLKKALVTQFLTESVLLSFLALILSVGMTWLLLPLFNSLAEKQISILVLFRPLMLTGVLVLMLVMGLLAGSYPAFVLSAFNPVEVLKGSLSKGFKSSRLRNVLVVFQFAVSIVLIIGTLVIYRQLGYMRNKDIGFNKEQVLILHNTGPLGDQAKAFENEISNISGVKNVTMTSFLPVDGSRNTDAIFTEPTLDLNKAISMQEWFVDENYIPTLQFKLLKGRNFSPQFPSDSSAIIINEAALKYLGTGDPLSKKLYEIDDEQTKKIASYRIIGVVKNFNFNSLRDQITPVLMKLGRNTGSMAVRIQTNYVPELVSQIERKYKMMASGEPFSYDFMDESFNRLYLTEQRTGKISITFSVVAILIACLGLFGLATYAATQRTREIGIRKVLGASISAMVNMLCKDFLRLVLISSCIAFPLAWWLMNKWLQEFAYRIGISWWIFLLSGSIALLIAIFTVSFQALKAALSNPVKSLRTE
jgi:putative ABC transport system permease protein